MMNTPSGIVLAFDDGRGDNYHVWKEMLEPFGIPATFNITTAYNDGTADPRCLPTTIAPMGPKRIAEIAQSPLLEIGCHGREHICDAKDAGEGEMILRKWIGADEDQPLGYACPNSQLPVSALQQKEWNHFHYIRTGIRISNRVLLRTVIRKVNRFAHIPCFYRIAFAGCIMKKCRDRILYSATVFRDTKVEEILALVKLAIEEQGHLILLFHSVGEIPGPEGYWSYSEKKFCKLCELLLAMQKDGRIEMMTTAGLYERLKK